MKHKTISYICKQGLFVSLIIGCLFFTLSCEKENNIGAPVIKGIRVPDPAKADSFFTRSYPGRLIVITGENFDGLKHVYFNNADIPFNPVFVTSNNIMITIPGDMPLKGTDPTLPNTIRLVTDYGETTYDFKFLSADPSITFFKFRVPARQDSTLEIIGANFYEIKHIYMYRAVFDDSIEITNYTVSKTYDAIKYILPEGGDLDGHITIITESGRATQDYLASPQPEITGISSDMPITGDTCILYGKYFYALQKVVLPGNVEVPAKDLNVSPYVDQIKFKMPAITQSGKLKLVTDVKTVETPGIINDKSLVFYNLDDVNKNWDWGDHYDLIDSIGTKVTPYAASGKYVRISGKPGANNGWWGNYVVALKAWPAGIPDNTPISDLELKFEMYCVKPWGIGHFQMQMGDNWNSTYNFKPWEGTNIPVGKWISYSLPLTNFGTDVTTYADFKSSRKLDNGFGLYFKSGSDATFELNVCFDNFRIVKK